MRVVVLRALYKNSFVIGEPEVACCVMQQYGPIFTPAANAISTVPTNLEMDVQAAPPEGDFEVVHFDLLGLEVLEPNVPVPAYSATGGDVEEGTPDFAWFPGPSQVGIPAPSPDVVSYVGDFSGYQLLLDAEMGGAGAGDNGPGGGGDEGGGNTNNGAGNGAGKPAPDLTPPAPIPGLALPKLTLPVRDGQVVLPVQCANVSCVGSLLLQSLEQPGAKIATADHTTKKPKTVTYGSAKVSLKAGAKGSVRVRLNSSGRAATKGRHSLKAWANFTLGATKLSRRITLRG